MNLDLNLNDLPEPQRRQLERIYAADSRGTGINASAICRRYDVDFDAFRIWWLLSSRHRG